MNVPEFQDKDILTLMRNASNGKTKGKKKKLWFKKSDIVWIIQVYDCKKGKFNKVTPAHLERSKEEHQAAGEELVGALGVVSNNYPTKRSTKIYLVHDGSKADSNLQV